MNRHQFQVEITKFLAERLLTAQLALEGKIPPPAFRGLGKHAEAHGRRYYKAWQKVPKRVERQARVRLEFDCEQHVLAPGATWKAFMAGRRTMSWQLIHLIIRSVVNADRWVDGTAPDWGVRKPDHSKAGRRKARHRLIKGAREKPAAAVQDWFSVEIMDFKHKHGIEFTQFFESEFYRRVRKLEADLDELLELVEDDPMELRSGMLYEVLEPALDEVN